MSIWNQSTATAWFSLVLALSAGLVPGCARCSSSADKRVTVVGTWGGVELENFLRVCRAAGVEVQFETTRDLDAILTTRAQSDNLPDLAVLPNPAKLQELARKSKLSPLSFLERDQLVRDFGEAWIRLGSYAGQLYGLFFKISNKSLIWYNPQEFKRHGWTPARTWQELLVLTAQIHSEGKTPWAIGADLGWPLTDWIENLVLRSQGPQFYQDWAAHRIPWTHPMIAAAFRRFGEIAGRGENIWGGVDGALATTFQRAAFAVFRPEPLSYLLAQGDFVVGVASSQFPDLLREKKIASFPFPVIEPRYADTAVVGGDVIVAFRRTEGVEKLLRFLASTPAHEIWVARGGFLSHNRSVPLERYPDEISRELARRLRLASEVVFDASDLMPPAVGNQGGFWDACKRFLKDPSQIDSILIEMEDLAIKND